MLDAVERYELIRLYNLKSDILLANLKAYRNLDVLVTSFHQAIINILMQAIQYKVTHNDQAAATTLGGAAAA
jgi:hypothetical protein